MHTTGRNIYVITRPIIERRIFYYSSSRDGKQRKILHFHRKVHTGTGKRIINDPQSSSSIPLLTEYEPICKMVIKLRGSSFVNNLASGWLTVHSVLNDFFLTSGSSRRISITLRIKIE